MSTAPEKLLTVEEVATIYGVHKNTVWNWLNSGKLKGHRVETAKNRNKDGRGVVWQIRASDLAEMMQTSPKSNQGRKKGV